MNWPLHCLHELHSHIISHSWLLLLLLLAMVLNRWIATLDAAIITVRGRIEWWWRQARCFSADVLLFQTNPFWRIGSIMWLRWWRLMMRYIAVSLVQDILVITGACLLRLPWRIYVRCVVIRRDCRVDWRALINGRRIASRNGRIFRYYYAFRIGINFQMLQLMLDGWDLVASYWIYNNSKWLIPRESIYSLGRRCRYCYYCYIWQQDNGHDSTIFFIGNDDVKRW